MKKLLILPGLLLLSAMLPCTDTKCATDMDMQKKPVKTGKMTHKKAGKWHMLRKQGIVLDVTGANHKDVKCIYKEPFTNKKGEARPAAVFCKRDFKNVQAAKKPVYTTGTPSGKQPAEMYENYIGSYTIPGKGLGGNQRIDLCDGPCKEIEKAEVKVIS